MAVLIRCLNEAAVCFGSGVFGFTSVLFKSNTRQFVKYVGFSAIGAGIVVGFIKSKPQKKLSDGNLVVITGCDSGLGYNMARHCHKLGMYVCATCLNTKSDGARKLLEQSDPKRFHLLELDVRKSASILHIQKSITNLLISNPELEFTTLINNAGIMVFGEFEWQTSALIENQINVNLIGTMNFTKSLMPLIRQHKTRIINVTSHCALEALPGLAPYAASKAALRFWNDAMRVELKKYGVDVVSFIPGSLVMSTNITARQDDYANEMRQAFSPEQLEFYEDYFDRYNGYLKYISGIKPAQIIIDEGLFERFERALKDCPPEAVYKYEPWRYTIYHFLFKFTPIIFRDWLVVRFMNMPEYRTK